MAFGVGQVKNESLVARLLASVRQILVASPDFLEKLGKPKDSIIETPLPVLFRSAPPHGGRPRRQRQRQIR